MNNLFIFNSKKYLYIFFCLFFFFLVLSYLIVNNYFFIRSHEYIISRLYLDRKSENVILGDSVLAYDFIGQKNFINLSQYSLNSNDMINRLNFYFSDYEPKKVVLNYSPSLFSEYRYKAEKIDIPNKNFLFNLKYFYKVEFKKLNKYWLIFLNDFFLDNKKNLRSFNEYGGLINENYWLDVKKNKRIELALDRAKLHEIKLDIMQKETMKMMEAIDLLRKKNHSVEICLITPPYSNEYINFLKQQKDYTTFLDYGAKLNTIKNLKYINFIDYYSNNQNFFADQEHLNSLGAINFSSILLKKCF